MKIFVKIVFVLVSLISLVYVGYPSPDFPQPLSDSVQSQEPADSETQLRRAYFTNFTREEVITHYKEKTQFPLRLNYPPEEAQTLIRDQTRSTFLEELTLPLRESLFINGFEPKDAKDDIWYKGQHFRQKITVRYIPSNPLYRMIITSLTLLSIWLLLREYWLSIKK